MKYIRLFRDVRLTDIPLVGGKNASLGQMIADLSAHGIRVPDGFAITADAYRHYLSFNNLDLLIENNLARLTQNQDLNTVAEVGNALRTAIKNGVIPADLRAEIEQAYEILCQEYQEKEVDVALRSSATAEDLPTASFAGQQQTFLHVHSIEQVLRYYKECLASLFTDRALVYRAEKNFMQASIALSVGVQKMIRSDKACSGVAFSLDTETGFKDVVTINASYGLGESIVQGLVTPDEFVVHKPTLAEGFAPIIKKVCGNKETKVIYSRNETTETVSVSSVDRQRFTLTDQEIIELARMVVVIESLYSELKSGWCPVDVEWAKDGNDNQLYIVQARPETVHSQEKKGNSFTQYVLDKGKETPQILATGQSIGQLIASGKVKIIKEIKDGDRIQTGDILVTEMTDPDWVPVMQRAAGIITQRGGRTCHAAIVSRELGVPAIVGVEDLFAALHDDQEITLDCSQGDIGYIYDGIVHFVKHTIVLDDIPNLSTSIMVNCADPAAAFSLSFLPVDGVGLTRLEFVISNVIKIHPLALLHPERVKDQEEREEIDRMTERYEDKKDFFIEQLSQAVGMIAAAFYPKSVVVRFSDFKSNEYSALIGGQFFEPKEENPMLGVRGAFRYTHDPYEEAFSLECAAIKKVRDFMGFSNVICMVPFVRSVAEAKKVIDVLERNGLKQGQNGLKIFMMCETPSNVLLMEQFSAIFDGFSIGSNDLAQLTLGVDRDSPQLAHFFDERDSAVMKMMEMAVQGAHARKRYIGICGQAPSDYPEIADFLMKVGIDSLSLNQDSVVPFLMRFSKK